MLWAILLLVLSNIFMTFAWYGHLKFKQAPMWLAVLASWVIASLEYCLQVPANRLGSDAGISTPTLKITQEVITLIVFGFFTTFFLEEPLHWKHLVGFSLILGAVAVMNLF